MGKKNKYYRCYYRGYYYLVGKLDDLWWICEEGESEYEGSVIYKEYEWGGSMDEVLDLKGLDQSNVL